MPPPEDKKTNSSKLVSREVTRLVAPREGTLTKTSDVLRHRASILRSPSMVEKILEGMIPPTDREKVDKLSLD